ncbi:TPA: hypothetical protein HA251_07695 [Candidatus Woesearchaeota archaeon]|nr:hypothetical protein [Candidatus Woesearchaeota archaeon]
MDRVVGIIDKPSTKSFGMLALLIAHGPPLSYSTSGLSDASRTRIDPLTVNTVALCGSSYLYVDDPVPALEDAVAVWIGAEFERNARTLEAPPLPPAQGWKRPLSPDIDVGRYEYFTPAQASDILNSWVKKTAIIALQRHSYDLAVLTRWTLPSSITARTALYFTGSEKQKKNVIGWDLMGLLHRNAEECVAAYDAERRRLLRD